MLLTLRRAMGQLPKEMVVLSVEHQDTSRGCLKREEINMAGNGNATGIGFYCIWERRKEGNHQETLMRMSSRNQVRLKYGEKVENAFQLIRAKLCSAPILALPEGSEDCGIL
ncbi:hypothetical protein Tco_1243052 [Tanacetum coccineum]